VTAAGSGVKSISTEGVVQESARNLPQLYRSGQRNESFTAWILLGWLLSALWESIVVFYTSVWTLQAAVDSSGILLGMWSAGTLAYTLIATIVSPKDHSPATLWLPLAGCGLSILEITLPWKEIVCYHLTVGSSGLDV
jgi:hypothetical protein